MKTMGESNAMVKLFEIETQTNKHNKAKCVCYDDRIVLSTHHTGGFHLFELYTYHNEEKTIWIKDIGQFVISGGAGRNDDATDSQRRYIQMFMKGEKNKSFDELCQVSLMIAVNHSLDHNSIYFSNYRKKDLEKIYQSAYRIQKYIAEHH